MKVVISDHFYPAKSDSQNGLGWHMKNQLTQPPCHGQRHLPLDQICRIILQEFSGIWLHNTPFFPLPSFSFLTNYGSVTTVSSNFIRNWIYDVAKARLFFKHLPTHKGLHCPKIPLQGTWICGWWGQLSQISITSPSEVEVGTWGTGRQLGTRTPSTTERWIVPAPECPALGFNVISEPFSCELSFIYVPHKQIFVYVQPIAGRAQCWALWGSAARCWALRALTHRSWKDHSEEEGTGGNPASRASFLCWGKSPRAVCPSDCLASLLPLAPVPILPFLHFFCVACGVPGTFPQPPVSPGAPPCCGSRGCSSLTFLEGCYSCRKEALTIH